MTGELIHGNMKNYSIFILIKNIDYSMKEDFFTRGSLMGTLADAEVDPDPPALELLVRRGRTSPLGILERR